MAAGAAAFTENTQTLSPQKLKECWNKLTPIIEELLNDHENNFFTPPETWDERTQGLFLDRVLVNLSSKDIKIRDNEQANLKDDLGHQDFKSTSFEEVFKTPKELRETIEEKLKPLYSNTGGSSQYASNKGIN